MAPISGAPRTSIARIAWVASASLLSRAVSKAKGSRVWSMMPTLEPSASSQIGRQGLPSTFMDSILLRATLRLWKCLLPRAASTIEDRGRRINCASVATLAAAEMALACQRMELAELAERDLH